MNEKSSSKQGPNMSSGPWFHRMPVLRTTEAVFAPGRAVDLDLADFDAPGRPGDFHIDRPDKGKATDEVIMHRHVGASKSVCLHGDVADGLEQGVVGRAVEFQIVTGDAVRGPIDVVPHRKLIDLAAPIELEGDRARSLRRAKSIVG